MTNVNNKVRTVPSRVAQQQQVRDDEDGNGMCWRILIAYVTDSESVAQAWLLFLSSRCLELPVRERDEVLFPICYYVSSCSAESRFVI